MNTKQILSLLNIFKIIFVLLFFFTSSLIFSRDVAIIVLDADLDIPLEGATVRVRDGTVYTCNQNGRAVIQAPDDRQIIIQIFYPGYEAGIVTIPVNATSITVPLRLSGVLQGRELIVEASKPGTSETRTGRSIAVTAREISQTAEIGIVEDVMSTIKLLPGVNYTGLLSAQPSIRGGHPGDMSASLDGFYVKNPYFWGGGFSIFDPRMVQSAQLSHGVFSSRYGHTISGLLEITTKKPSSTETQFELGINTSAANFNLSVPFFGRGGLLVMGRITYYDPVISIARELAPIFPELEYLKYIKRAPYIRAGTLSGNYRFTDNLELTTTGFWGMDGMSVNFLNSSSSSLLESDTTADFDFFNYQGFFTSSLLWNPRPDMLISFTAGTGYVDRIIKGEMNYNIHNRYFSDQFKVKYSDLNALGILNTPYSFYDFSLINQSEFLYDAQGRIDFDFVLSEHLLFSLGVQEMFNWYSSAGDQKVTNDIRFNNLSQAEQALIKMFFPLIPANSPVWNDLRVSVPINYSPYTKNYLLTSSGYVLSEYNYNNRFKAELGLRLDHFYLIGDGFSLYSDPVLNPRLNLELNLLKTSGFLKSFDISAGSGLFSSINDNVFAAEKRYNIHTIKPDRSWTSILGFKFEFPESISLNIEGYYKYVFDRMYIPMAITLDDLDIQPHFDGEGMVFGLDVMLHKVQSRFWDGWLSYSFNYSKYRDPQGRFNVRGISGGNRGDDWYFPHFHRFHNLNLVFNVRPVSNFNIYVRFGYASGVPLSRRSQDGPISYPVLLYGQNKFIEKYYWPSYIDESNRTTPSLPFDIKLSFFGSNKNGKTRYEFYVALENILAFVYTAEGNTSFNSYTGQVDTGSNSASYEIPMPIPSFGFKISY